MVKKLNIKLDSTKPADLINMLETFIALLRNKSVANHVDVKLYLQEVSKLKFKMKTIDCTKLDVKLVKAHQARIKEMAPCFKETGENGEYSCFHEWSTNFCSYAVDLLMQKSFHDNKSELTDTVANLEAEIKSNTDLISVYENPALVEYFKDEHTKNELL